MDAAHERASTFDASRSELRAALDRINELESELRRLRAEHGSSTTTVIPQMRLLDVEAWAVRHAMERAEGNISRAARALGLSRAALYRRLERHALRQ
jgi:transcriptional regulator of acetoin/glycerol metabolism